MFTFEHFSRRIPSVLRRVCNRGGPKSAPHRTSTAKSVRIVERMRVCSGLGARSQPCLKAIIVFSRFFCAWSIVLLCHAAFRAVGSELILRTCHSPIGDLGIVARMRPSVFVFEAHGPRRFQVPRQRSVDPSNSGLLCRVRACRPSPTRMVKLRERAASSHLREPPSPPGALSLLVFVQRFTSGASSPQAPLRAESPVASGAARVVQQRRRLRPGRLRYRGRRSAERDVATRTTVDESTRSLACMPSSSLLNALDRHYRRGLI